MVHLENEAFLSELTRLFQKSRTAGAVYITMKQYNGQTKPKTTKPKTELVTEPAEHMCLIRATRGNKKITTVAYSNIIKANMDGLKKRDRKGTKAKSKKAKATQRWRDKECGKRSPSCPESGTKMLIRASPTRTEDGEIRSAEKGPHPSPSISPQALPSRPTLPNSNLPNPSLSFPLPSSPITNFSSVLTVS
ncbi:RNA-binding signal recognition particle subunit srp14 [Branchiostoma belcheri]|nr:RNA-binding signal recognition particle subunit srp14 [Branchiostoma belcheri]